MRKLMVTLAGLGLLAVVLIGVPELVLRLFPSLISVAVLDRMHPDLRSEIAARLDLPVESDYAVIASAERADKGPDLFLMKPGREYYRPVDEADRTAGAIDRVKADAHGFCNPASAAGQDSFDIVAVGGSVPNCAGVDGEGVFPAQLGRLTGAASYNMAVAGVGPYEYLEVLGRYGTALKPKVVIFAISEANDLRDCERYLDHLAGKTRDRKSKAGGPFRVSYFLAFVKASFELLSKTVSAAAHPDFRYSVQAEGRTVAMNVMNGDGDELKSAKEMAEGTLPPDLYAAPLTRFVDMARAGGFRPVVVLVPAAYTVYRDGIVFDDPSIAGTMARYSDAQREWLAANAAAIGYDYLDATGYLQQKAAGPLLYFPADMHLTAAGHAALAEAVAEPVAAMLAAAPAVN